VSCSHPRGIAAARDGDRAQRSTAMRTDAEVSPGECREARPPVEARRAASGPAEVGGGALARLGRRGSVQADVADLVQAVGQHVPDEASKERHRGKCFCPSVLGAEGDGVLTHGEQAAVGDADAVRVAPEVREHVPGLGEGGLGVHVPGGPGRALHQTREALGVDEVVEPVEVVRAMRVVELLKHLGAEDARHGGHGEQKASMGGTPPRTLGRPSSGSDDGVDVGMKAQVARPGVQHQRGAEGGVQAPASKLQQGALRSREERVVDDSWRERGERAQLRWQCEDDVEVPRVEHPRSTRFDPLLLGERLALGAVPIAARVVRGMLVSAPGTSIHVAAEHRGTALRDVG